MTSLFEAFEVLKQYYLQKIEEIVKEQEKIKAQDISSDNDNEVKE